MSANKGYSILNKKLITVKGIYFSVIFDKKSIIRYYLFKLINGGKMDPITWGGKVLRGKIIRHPDMKPFSLQRAVLQMFLDCPDVSKNDLNKIKTAIKEFMTTQENPAVKKVCQTILDR